MAPHQVRFVSGGYLLDNIAEALRAPCVADVWACGLLTRNVHVLLRPGSASGGGDSAGGGTVRDLDSELEVGGQ